MLLISTYFLALLFFSASIGVRSESFRNISRCFPRLITEELHNAYNYFQLSTNVGGEEAYPGFASFYAHLSDVAVSKAHDLSAYLALRHIEVSRLIDPDGKGIHVGSTVHQMKDVEQSLSEVKNQNNAVLLIVRQCHDRARETNDAHAQDYLEKHFFPYHIELAKDISDYLHRLKGSTGDDQVILTEMLNGELLEKFGDLRKDLFAE